MKRTAACALALAAVLTVGRRPLAARVPYERLAATEMSSTVCMPHGTDTRLSSKDLPKA